MATAPLGFVPQGALRQVVKRAPALLLLDNYFTREQHAQIEFLRQAIDRAESGVVRLRAFFGDEAVDALAQIEQQQKLPADWALVMWDTSSVLPQFSQVNSWLVDQKNDIFSKIENNGLYQEMLNILINTVVVPVKEAVEKMRDLLVSRDIVASTVQFLYKNLPTLRPAAGKFVGELLDYYSSMSERLDAFNRADPAYVITTTQLNELATSLAIDRLLRISDDSRDQLLSKEGQANLDILRTRGQTSAEWRNVAQDAKEAVHRHLFGQFYAKRIAELLIITSPSFGGDPGTEELNNITVAWLAQAPFLDAQDGFHADRLPVLFAIYPPRVERTEELMNLYSDLAYAQQSIGWLGGLAIRKLMILEIVHWRAVIEDIQDLLGLDRRNPDFLLDSSTANRESPYTIHLSNAHFQHAGPVEDSEGLHLDKRGAAARISIPIEARYWPDKTDPADPKRARRWLIVMKTTEGAPPRTSRVELAEEPTPNHSLDLTQHLVWTAPVSGTIQVTIQALNDGDDNPLPGVSVLQLPLFRVHVKLRCVRCSGDYEASSNHAEKHQCQWYVNVRQFRENRALSTVHPRLFRALSLTEEAALYVSSRIELLIKDKIVPQVEALRNGTRRGPTRQIAANIAAGEVEISEIKKEYGLGSLPTTVLGFEIIKQDNYRLVWRASSADVLQFWINGALSYEDLLSSLGEMIVRDQQTRSWPTYQAREDIVDAGGLAPIHKPRIVADIPGRLLKRFHEFLDELVNRASEPNYDLTRVSPLRIETHAPNRAQLIAEVAKLRKLTLAQLAATFERPAHFQLGHSPLVQTPVDHYIHDTPEFMHDVEGEEKLDVLLSSGAEVVRKAPAEAFLDHTFHPRWPSGYDDNAVSSQLSGAFQRKHLYTGPHSTTTVLPDTFQLGLTIVDDATGVVKRGVSLSSGNIVYQNVTEIADLASMAGTLPDSVRNIVQYYEEKNRHSHTTRFLVGTGLVGGAAHTFVLALGMPINKRMSLLAPEQLVLSNPLAPESSDVVLLLSKIDRMKATAERTQLTTYLIATYLPQLFEQFNHFLLD